MTKVTPYVFFQHSNVPYLWTVEVGEVLLKCGYSKTRCGAWLQADFWAFKLRKAGDVYSKGL